MYLSLRIHHRDAFLHSNAILLLNLTKYLPSEHDPPSTTSCPWNCHYHLRFELPLHLQLVPLLITLPTILVYLQLPNILLAPYLRPLSQLSLRPRLLNPLKYRWLSPRRNHSRTIFALTTLHDPNHPTRRNTSSQTARDSSSLPSSSRSSTTENFAWAVRLGDTRLFHCTS